MEFIADHSSTMESEAIKSHILATEKIERIGQLEKKTSLGSKCETCNQYAYYLLTDHGGINCMGCGSWHCASCLTHNRNLYGAYVDEYDSHAGMASQNCTLCR